MEGAQRVGFVVAIGMVLVGVLGMTISTRRGIDVWRWASSGVLGGGLGMLIRVGYSVRGS